MSNKRFIPVIVILCVSFLLSVSFLSCQMKDKKVLIYTKNGEGFIHDNIQASVDMLSQLCEDNSIEYDLSDDPSVFTEDNLQQYDALIFSNTNNEAFDNNEQRLVFKRYIQAGGGFVGIHSACGSERQWPWFWKMLGGTFVRHCPGQEFLIKITDPTHPSTEHFTGDWEGWSDEGYYLHHLNPDIHVLLSHDMTTIEDNGKDEYPGTIFGDLYPGAWCHEFDGGKEWYTSYGHNIDHYSDANFQKHILGGILWTIDKPKPDFKKAKANKINLID
jgi:uncharacterized protein